jgi:3-keto-L-gulonate-6-phosphate decarboxylase
VITNDPQIKKQKALDETDRQKQRGQRIDELNEIREEFYRTAVAAGLPKKEIEERWAVNADALDASNQALRNKDHSEADRILGWAIANARQLLAALPAAQSNSKGETEPTVGAQPA